MDDEKASEDEKGETAVESKNNFDASTDLGPKDVGAQQRTAPTLQPPTSPEYGGGRAMKRDSLFVGELDGFDPANLELEDNWGNVFAEDEDDDFLDNVNEDRLSSPTGDSSSALSSTTPLTPGSLMPPPPLVASLSASTPSAMHADSSNQKNADVRGFTTNDIGTASYGNSKITVPVSKGLSSNTPSRDTSLSGRKRTSLEADRRGSAPPPVPPTWHSEAADAQHRQAMVQDISKLLYARKKGKNPSRQWLERVPIKARLFESQLYKNATSLEAYLNRSTLKMRIGKLASAITSHYKGAIHGPGKAKRSSTVSISSLASLEDAFADAGLRRGSELSVSSATSGEPANTYSSSLVTEAPSQSATTKFDSLLGLAPGGRNSSNDGSMTDMGVMMNNNNGMGQNGSTNFALNQGGMTQEQQQLQLLQNLQQQQQLEMARRISGGGGGDLNGQMMGNVATANNPVMAINMMMRGGMFPAMAIQQQQQQQQTMMNLSLLQQQQLLLQQQQMQQVQLPFQQTTNFSLSNISIMQQQQQLQLQQQQMQHSQQQNQFMGLNVGAGNGNFNDINATNANNMVPTGFPFMVPGMSGTGVARSTSTGDVNNSYMVANNSMNAPAASSSASPTPPPNLSPGVDETNADELSPGSFNW